MVGVGPEPYTDVDEDRGVAVPDGPETARRELDDAVLVERDNVPLSEKKRRVDDVRFGGTNLVAGGESGGELGPRRLFRRWIAAGQSVQGWVWLSPTCPQPLCCV